MLKIFLYFSSKKLKNNKKNKFFKISNKILKNNLIIIMIFNIFVLGYDCASGKICASGSFALANGALKVYLGMHDEQANGCVFSAIS